MFTLPESERLKSRAEISALMTKGRWGFTSGLKYCVFKESGEGAEKNHDVPEAGQDRTENRPNKIMVSVPKRLFKRAVKRNLLKRRLREAYRTQKQLLPSGGHSIMFLYNSKEVMDFAAVRGQVKDILEKIARDEAK